MRLKSFVSALLLTTASVALRAEFVPVVNTTLSLGGASVSGDDPAALGVADLYVVPAWKRGRFSLLPSLSGSLGGQQRSIAEGTTFERTAQANFSPTTKWQLGLFQAVRFRLQSLRTWNLQTANESWGRGLYDYEQYGLGGAYEFLSIVGPVELDLDFSHRSYPNYRNVAAAAALLENKDYYIKDYYGTGFKVVLTLPGAGLKLSYAPEYKVYPDSYVIKRDGSTDLAQQQRDWTQQFGTEGMLPFSKNTGLLYSLKLAFNNSNQNYFDSLAVTPTFVPGFQDYTSQTLSLANPWLLNDLWSGLTVTPAYELTLVQSGKLVQNSDAAYTQDKMQSVDNGFKLGAEKTFGKGFAWALDSGYRVSRSNQGLDRGHRSNFEYWQVTTGLKYTFKGE